MFKFAGSLLASKSWMNRALVIQSFNPQIKIIGETDSDDVKVLQKAIESIPYADHFYLGQGGTSLRFFAFLASRKPGTWFIKAHARLLERPQKELKETLKQLGIEVEFQDDEIIIRSQGWKNDGTVMCDTKLSSQFASGLILNSWNLEFDLQVQMNKPIISADYLWMTLDILKTAGLKYHLVESEASFHLSIPKCQKPSSSDLHSEVDVSSTFSLVAAAVVAGDVQIENWNSSSVQPDMAFTKILNQMGILFQQQANQFTIKQQSSWNACEINLNKSPDLFPVLSVLCALGKGTSQLYGAEQLKLKESDRITKTKELLDLAGFRSELLVDGLAIYGLSSAQDKNQALTFNPDHDHRMAMAAGILKLAGYNIKIETPEVVQKSYPQFWQHTGVNP
ncbi:MAG: hypothetical protein H7328_12590 [Bdellovibrio sp.]|nr:hypothetical protein [Bdellovibrio sp.]